MDCCIQGSCQTITYESQVTLQSQMVSTRLTTIQYGWSGACCSRVFPQVVQVGDKSSFQEEFMDFCMSPLTPKVTAITEVDKWHAISQIKDCLEIEYHYSTLAKLAKAILVILHSNADTRTFIQSHWSQQNEAQKQTRGFYIKFTFNSAIQCSSKML